MGQTHRWIWLLTSILCFITAGIAFFNPAVNLLVASIFIIVAIGLSGVAQIFMYFQMPSGDRSGGLLAWGLLSLLIAIWAASSNTAELLELAPIFLIFWIMMSGFFRIMMGWKLHENHMPKSGLFFIVGIISVVIGVWLLRSPLVGMLFTSYYIGIVFAWEGISSLTHFWNHDVYDL